MPVEKLQHRLYGAWKRTILYENDSIQTCTLLKCWNNLIAQKALITFTINITGNAGTVLPIF